MGGLGGWVRQGKDLFKDSGLGIVSGWEYAKVKASLRINTVQEGGGYAKVRTSLSKRDCGRKLGGGGGG